MSKVSRGYSVSDKTHNYLKKVKEKNNLSSLSLALERVVTEHEKSSKINVEETAKLMSKEIGKVLKDDIVKFKVSARESDKNMQILIEMFNGYLIKAGTGAIVTTTGLATELSMESPAFKIAKEEVKKRIHRNKIKKFNRIKKEDNINE